MQQYIKPRRSRWLVAPCREICKTNSPDHGLGGVEDFPGVAVVSTQCSNHRDKTIKCKHPVDNHLQPAKLKGKNNTHQLGTINVAAAKVGAIGHMNAPHLNKVTFVVVDVVDDIPVADQCEEEEEDGMYNVAEDEMRQ